jgi:hypothetical protein
MKKILLYIVLLIFCFTVGSCEIEDTGRYKTFTMYEGVIHFSLESPEKYKIDSNRPAEAEGDRIQQSTLLSLDGPLNKIINDYTKIIVSAGLPEPLLPNAQGAIARIEKQAAKWDGYELLNKSEIEVSGYQGYRIDYRMVNIVPVIAGDSEEPRYSVYRDVRFDAKGYVWMIQISSDSSTAEEDKEDFEHILKTFKVLE